ncbi:MAG: SDR family oxidoreductase [Ramlibacter sp.]
MNETVTRAPLVFITGASSGIGQALAERYAKDGWRLALVARRGDVLHDWVRAQGLDPERASVHVADVADIESITAAGRACIAAQGLPDVVIANAGISIGMDSAQREDLDVMVRTFATNNVGVAATFHPFIEPMARRGRGTLVGIASVAGIRGMPGHGAYCASKAAVISYCESLRGELRPQGVKVVTISPGYIATLLTSRNRYPMPFLMAPADFADRAVRAIAAGVPHRVIPWPMAVIAMLLRVLPASWLDRLLAGRPRKHRQGEA